MKHFFNFEKETINFYFKINNFKDDSVINRQLSLVHKRISEQFIYPKIIIESCVATTGTVDYDFVKNKFTLLLSYKYL